MVFDDPTPVWSQRQKGGKSDKGFDNHIHEANKLRIFHDGPDSALRATPKSMPQGRIPRTARDPLRAHDSSLRQPNKMPVGPSSRARQQLLATLRDNERAALGPYQLEEATPEADEQQEAQPVGLSRPIEFPWQWYDNPPPPKVCQRHLEAAAAPSPAAPDTPNLVMYFRPDAGTLDCAAARPAALCARRSHMPLPTSGRPCRMSSCATSGTRRLSRRARVAMSTRWCLGARSGAFGAQRAPRARARALCTRDRDRSTPPDG
eukprot:6990400-Prymnesium_polylepis.1